jgi:hypothetical protein
MRNRMRRILDVNPVLLKLNCSNLFKSNYNVSYFVTDFSLSVHITALQFFIFVYMKFDLQFLYFFCTVTWDTTNMTTVKSTIFLDITPCSPLKVYRRFGGTYRFHLQGWKISRTRNERESRWRYIPEDSTLHKHRGENLKSYMTTVAALNITNHNKCSKINTFSNI